ncbi:MAG: Abhydrolase, bacterial [Gemmatimonadetes bacterium]|jgi:dienelactone hydrolase|nr:Abhydrolase, bacterial [Gemmatimonadota bacterium]
MTDDIGRREFLKRGGMAGVMATSGLPLIETLAHAREPSAAAVVATAEHPSLAGRRFDTREFCLSEYDALAPKLSFTASDASAAKAWQARARAKLIDRLGGFPSTKAPLNPEVLETIDFGSYTREKIVFDTRHNLSALGYLLVPKGGVRPLPAVVCVSGHGRGLADILGMNDDGSSRAERGVGYAKEYALQCVEQGYVTFAVEQLALGARRDEAARKAGPTANSCQPAACAALLLGQSMAAWRVWDAMRAIDYLSTRREVDASRIATLGASGGGTTSLLTGAMDERVKVAVVSAYFNTFRDSIVSIAHCPDNYVPGLLQDMEMYDLSGLVAPRRLFVESGRKDRIFPIEGFQVATAKAQAIYRAFGVPDHFGSEIHEGAHEFNGVGAFAFMKRWL